MNHIQHRSGFKPALLAVLLASLLAACDGGKDPILGDAGTAELAPSVTVTSPAAGAVGVPVGARTLTASFSKAMNPATLTDASFTLACPTGTAVTGTVSYAAATRIASFAAASDLPGGTNCTATISTAAQDSFGIPLTAAVNWSFTTATPPDATPPTVSSTTPLAGASGVAFNTLITTSFSEAMDPPSIDDASFTLACPAGTAVGGRVSYSADGDIATLTPTANLPPSTLCNATISTAARDAAGNALAAPFNWSFTTGAAADTTAPTVISTLPAAAATAVALNTRVTASFSEPMNPASLNASSVTVACPAGTAIAGTVSYVGSSNTVRFTPTANLPASTTCSARISTGARDAAGNALASAFNWSFTTGAAGDTAAPTVTSTNSADGAVGVCTNKTINALFSEPMDPLSITTASFTLEVTGGASVPGVVAYDAATRIATFNPSADLIGTPPTNYTATIRGGVNGVKDLAGNALAGNRTSRFTTNASTCTAAPALGAAATFGSFGGNATLTNDGLDSVINGDVGVNAASSSITGFRDSGGNVYTVTPNNDGRVNGLVYSLTAPPGSVAGAAVTAARSDATQAFNAISPANLPGGLDVSSLAQCPSCGGAGGGPDELAGRTLPPGVYLSTTGTYDIGGAGRTTANLTLDAGGDANAVWVFQTAAGTGTLNVGLTGPATPAVPIQVRLINGAQARNVFWYVPGGAVIGTGSTVVGTLLADSSITLSTTGGSPPTAVITRLDGRAIALTSAVTMTNTVINLPAP